MMRSLDDDETYDYIYVDGLNLCFRNYHGMSNLEYRGYKTGMLYGICRFFTTIRSENRKANIIFLWEGRNSWRKAKYPFYKAKRDARGKGKTYDSEFIESLEYIQQEVLPVMGVEQHSCETYEADDIASFYVYCHQTNYLKCIKYRMLLVSTDQDWYSMSADNVDILYRKGIKNKAAIEKELGFSADKLILFKALKGDPSDEVGGIPNFRTVTAVRLANECDTFYEFADKLDEWGDTKWAEKVRANSHILVRNTELISPKYPLPLDVINVVESVYDKERLIEALKPRGMNETVNILRRW